MKINSNFGKDKITLYKNKMFNGIIYNKGIVSKIIKRPKGINIFIKINLNYLKKILVLSVACDGVCLL